MEYILSLLIFIGADLICNLTFGAPSNNGVYAIILIILWVFMLMQGAKRCHDIGNSGWWQLIPLYFIWLMIAKGDEGENEYGEPEC
ncbi:MAG: DUF805 domain-containing protein [Aeriscardovia sp.]|nr:DUF805 domain-containing protein [Aeriscardovia sp.]